MSIAVPFNEQDLKDGIAGALGPAEDPASPAPDAPVAQPAATSPLDAPLPDSDEIAEKFRNQPLKTLVKSQAEAERVFHENQAKLKSTEYELQLSKTANAALKEQYEALRAPVAHAPAAVDPWEGLKLEEDVILNPRGVLDRALSIAEQNLEKRFKAEADRAQAADKKKAEDGMALHAAVTAAEAARTTLGKTQEEWMPFVQDLAPAVFQAGRQLDPNAYVEAFRERQSRYSGATSTVEVRVQGQPPVIAKSTQAAIAPVRPSSLSERQLVQAEQYAELFGIDRDKYIARVAANLTPKETV